ncbi:MAG TPA: hypothetical protein VF163_21500 [Micromonosporaceae bacterium]
MGISDKRFGGWEPAETHEHEYDDAGRLVRTVVTREPEWDEQERAWMLALRLYRAQVGPCGHYLPDTTAAAAEERWVGSHIRCHACTAVRQTMDTYKDSPHPQALLFLAERR